MKKKEKVIAFHLYNLGEGFGIMGLKIAMCNAFLLGLVVLLCSWISCGEASVSYDSQAITVNGQRKILISGSIHYPRSTPEVYLWQMYIRVCVLPNYFTSCFLYFEEKGCS